MILTIDGVAGAGKTTLAAFITLEFQDRFSIQVVHMDDLYDGWDEPLGAGLTQKLIQIAHAHQEQRPFHGQRYNWQSAARDESFVIAPVDLLILEGVGSGQRLIREFVETKIWIELKPIIGLQRVLERDGVQIESQMMGFLEQQKKHFLEEGTREAADFHLNGEH